MVLLTVISGRTSPRHSFPSSTGLCLLLRLFEERQVCIYHFYLAKSHNFCWFFPRMCFFLFRVFLFLGLVGMSYSLWMWIRNGVSWANIWNTALLIISLGGVHFVPFFLCFLPITFTFRDHGGNVFSTAWTFSRLSSIQCYHLVKHFQIFWI